jgi:hypothetical protein
MMTCGTDWTTTISSPCVALFASCIENMEHIDLIEYSSRQGIKGINQA